jgi:uncharacterized membrane protein YjjP (DUF1212 family)
VTALEPHAADVDVEFLLRFAREARAAGYSTAELEERVDEIARSLGMADDLLDHRLGTGDALVRLASIRAEPLRRSKAIELSAYGVAGAALTPVLGGGWREALAGEQSASSSA